MERFPDNEGRDKGIENNCGGPETLPEGLAFSSQVNFLRNPGLANHGMTAEVLA